MRDSSTVFCSATSSRRLTVKAGQTHVQKFMPELLEAIGEGKLRPEVIISHRMKLSEAESAYSIFDKKEQDCRKVVLTP